MPGRRLDLDTFVGVVVALAHPAIVAATRTLNMARARAMQADGDGWPVLLIVMA